jgi:hypothetical protein
VTASVRPDTLRMAAWISATAAILAIAVGTVARGFLGQDWFFTTDNLADSLPLALPFLVATGVVIGVDRWRAGRSWLLAGAWLLALDGALNVIFEIQLAAIMSDATSLETAEPWLVAGGVLRGTSLALGFAALAAGIWVSRVAEPGAGWRVAAVGLAVATAVLAVGPLAATIVGPTAPLSPTVVLSLVLSGAGVAAAGALGVAGLLAASRRAPVPELLIAAGAAAYALNRGLAWWWFALMPQESLLIWLTDLQIANVGLIAIAIGFALGVYFGSPED